MIAVRQTFEVTQRHSLVLGTVLPGSGYRQTEVHNETNIAYLGTTPLIRMHIFIETTYLQVSTQTYQTVKLHSELLAQNVSGIDLTKLTLASDANKMAAV